MINIELQNEQEAQVLINLLDIALKAKGLEVSEATIYFAKTIQEAINKSKEIITDNDKK